MLLLPDTVTLVEAHDALRMLEQSLVHETDATITVDASGLRRFDTSALAVLLECKRLAQAHGKGMALVRVPAKLADLARLYGLDALLLPAVPAA